MFIDTHCHLNDKAFYGDVDAVLKRAEAEGMDKVIIPGADPMELDLAIRLSEQRENVFFAVGIHPYDLHKGEIKYFLDSIKHPKCVAIGECGLDYFRLPEEDIQGYKNQQKEKFEEQIQIALDFDKPLILHVRESSNDVFEILQKYPTARGVLHCFNADEILLKLSDRFYYGIGGVCTFNNARKIVEILPKIPRDRLLLETDAPYLTPVPFRGQRNEPSYIPIIAQKIADILNLLPGDIEQLTTQNAKNLFKF